MPGTKLTFFGSSAAGNVIAVAVLESDGWSVLRGPEDNPVVVESGISLLEDAFALMQTLPT